MFERLKEIFQSGFIRSVSVLVGGTAIAQVISILILPILTRLYTPEDFSVLAVYAALLGVLSAVACLRFEIAIPLPENEGEAINLLVIAVGAALLFSATIGLIIFFFSNEISGLLNQPNVADILWLLPIGICATALYSAFQFWATRKKNFTRIARTRMEQAIGGSATQIAMGWFGLGPFGLVLGQVVNAATGLVGLAREFFKNKNNILDSVSWSEVKKNFKRYERFPKISTIESFANISAIQVPVLIIAAMAIGPEAGYLALAMRIMQAPLGLIGSAIAQVYLSQAPVCLHEPR